MKTIKLLQLLHCNYFYRSKHKKPENIIKKLIRFDFFKYFTLLKPILDI